MQHLGAPPPGITSRRGTARDDPNTKSDAMRSLEVRFLLPQASEGCDVHGKPCVHLPLNYPVARPHLAFRPIRLERKELRDAFTWYIQSSQRLQGKPVLPGCTWCGLPTGGFCDVLYVAIAAALMWTSKRSVASARKKRTRPLAGSAARHRLRRSITESKK